MRPALRSFTSLLLAALLLAWSSLCGAGVVSRCEGDAHGPCGSLPAPGACASSVEIGQDDAATYAELTEYSSQAEPFCGCPPTHKHSAVVAEMTLFQALTAPGPLWTEVFACPFPDPLSIQRPLAVVRVETGPDPVLPGPPPPHLACGPMLI